MEGLREIRATRDGMVIAISPIPNIAHREFTDSQLCDMLKQSAAQYAGRSKEQAVQTVPFTQGATVGCHATFTAANAGEKPFSVLPNRHHATVSAFLMSAQGVVFSMDLVSERLPDDDYLAIVNAIRQIE